ncbi:WXG100 family type VII secretion target [Williamsia sterculiae]|uniref:ESAT-6-like protein n=1 Tax=Williamsia sterculiae TaxID=1344003 RepID=A0A1N7GGN0_9NOCA|nr:WXG100 family type VII secretion target [Williamsia sterculiae]SIS11741.1 WXG100 family type VII secretion target [Williamsia sterculiae]
MTTGGDDFDVTLNELDELVQSMDTFNDKVAGIAEDIQSRIAKLHAQWQGLGATGHADFQDRWDQSIEEMRDGLDKVSAACRTAHGNYSKAVETNRGMWP